jgi:tetratricopeptide (TPR) repeat protein
LRALQSRLKGDLEALPQPDPKRQDRQVYERTRITSWLKEIADTLGDVDEYITLVESEQQGQVEAVPVARRLLAAGRLPEALAYLEKCTSRFASSESSDYPKLKSQILAALGRKDEAIEILWQEFADYPSMFRFEPILALTPNEDKAEAHQRAAALAESHRSPEQAAHYLVQINELDRAARLVQQRLGEISGAFYSIVAEVAQALAQSHPLQAWNLYRILLLDVLSRAHSKAYHHAVDYLACMEELAQKANIQSQQAEFVQSLRQTHGRKTSFWAQVKGRS